MDQLSGPVPRNDEYPAALKASLAAKGVVLGSAAVFALGLPAKLLLGLDEASAPGAILRLLVLLSAFALSLSCWGSFLLDSMCSLLGLMQARPARRLLALLAAILSLLPLALVLAVLRLGKGLGPGR